MANLITKLSLTAAVAFTFGALDAQAAPVKAGVTVDLRDHAGQLLDAPVAARAVDLTDRMVLLSGDARVADTSDRIVLLSGDARMADTSDRIVLLSGDARVADTSDRIVLLSGDARKGLPGGAEPIVLLSGDARHFTGCVMTVEASPNRDMSGAFAWGTGPCEALGAWIDGRDLEAGKVMFAPTAASTVVAETLELLLDEGFTPAEIDVDGLRAAAARLNVSTTDALEFADAATLLGLENLEAGTCGTATRGLAGYADAVCAALN